MSGNKDIHYRVLVPSDLKGALHVYESSMTDGPAYRSLGLKIPNDTFRLTDKFLPDVLSNGLSFGAFDVTSGNLVGIRLCNVITPHNLHMTYFDIDDPETRILAKLEQLFKYMTKDLDLFDGEKEIVKFCGLGVIKESRKRGIATRLVEESINLTRSKGYKYIVMEAGNVYSRRIAENNNFKCIKEEPYINIVHNGETWFKETTGNHKYDAIYKLEL